MQAVKRVMIAHEDRIEKKKVEFLKKIPELNLLTGTHIKKLSHTLQIIPFHKGKLIYSEGEPSTHIYIVAMG